VQVSHRFAAGSAVFDDDNLVSCAGLVSVMVLAEQAGLSELLAAKVRIAESKTRRTYPAIRVGSFGAGLAAPDF
jgi:hypothetical protein